MVWNSGNRNNLTEMANLPLQHSHRIEEMESGECEESMALARNMHLGHGCSSSQGAIPRSSLAGPVRNHLNDMARGSEASNRSAAAKAVEINGDLNGAVEHFARKVATVKEASQNPATRSQTLIATTGWMRHSPYVLSNRRKTGSLKLGLLDL